MFDDPKKELERLQEQLLKDEDWFEKELDSAKRMVGIQTETKRPATATQPAGVPRKTAPAPNSTSNYSRPAPQPQIRELKVEQEEVPMSKPRGIQGLLILAAIETLGIAGLAAYWLLVLLK